MKNANQKRKRGEREKERRSRWCVKEYKHKGRQGESRIKERDRYREGGGRGKDITACVWREETRMSSKGGDIICTILLAAFTSLGF